jgi:hypothetical protein
MRSAAIILAVLAGGLILTGGDAGPASAANYKLDMPKEAFGFRGTLSAQVARAPDKVYGWFEIKVVKVLSFARGNRTRLRTPQALTRVWKDKYAAVLGVKGMPELKVGDMVTVAVFVREVHLRASKVSKDKPMAARPDADATADGRKNKAEAEGARAQQEAAEKRGKVAAAKLNLIKTGYLEAGKADLVNKGVVRLKQFLQEYGDTSSAAEARRLLQRFAK